MLTHGNNNEKQPVKHTQGLKNKKVNEYVDKVISE